MTGFLLRLFARGGEHAAIGRLAGMTGIVCNVLLFLSKLLVGWLAGSVAVIADAVNNLSDAASSVVTLLGFRLAQRPADRDHPYGHARYEYLSGLVVAALILVIGFRLAGDSVEKILRPTAVEVTALTVLVLGASVGVKVWMSAFFRTLGRQSGSVALQATAADSRNDAVATGAVLLGCAVRVLFGWEIDGYVGLAVAGFILYSGVRIVGETVSPLLGRRADDALVARIGALVTESEGVLGCHDLLVHDYGPGQCFASVHVECSAGDNPLACHAVIDSIERRAWEELRVHLVIHYDPVVRDREWNEMQRTVEEIVCGLDARLQVHDLRIVHGEGKPCLVFDLLLPYGMQRRQEELRRAVEKELRSRGKNYDLRIQFDGA